METFIGNSFQQNWLSQGALQAFSLSSTHEGGNMKSHINIDCTNKWWEITSPLRVVLGSLVRHFFNQTLKEICRPRRFVCHLLFHHHARHVSWEILYFSSGEANWSLHCEENVPLRKRFSYQMTCNLMENLLLIKHFPDTKKFFFVFWWLSHKKMFLWFMWRGSQVVYSEFFQTGNEDFASFKENSWSPRAVSYKAHGSITE